MRVTQRPDTTNGVMFMTLEDETGSVNAIVWQSGGSAARRWGHHCSPLNGVWQREGDLEHLVAQRLVDVSHLLGDLPTSSPNLH